MPKTILQTKLNIPSVRPSHIPRPHLHRTLNQGVPRKFTLVSAPAGYGKTSLVTAWLKESSWPTAWLSLDEHDNEFGRFLRYLRLALQRLDEQAGAQLQTILENDQELPLETIASALLQDLTDLSEGLPKRPFLLILDDYHKIQQPAVHDLLSLLLDHLPAGCHLLLISREDPPLGLPRLRVGGDMVEIRAHDLRFTTAEIEQFFQQALSLHLAADWVAALEARTEGWAASLQLAALSLQGRTPTQAAAFIRDFGGSHRYVFDYLAEEVLSQQPAAWQTFLQQTAVLDRFHAPLCQAITGQADSQAILRQLEQANLFLIPLDEERQWYRYHHLFADYLRSSLPPADIAALQSRAARWCEDNSLLFESVHYALASGDLDLAAGVVERVIQKAAVWSSGELDVLVSWIDALPGQIFRARPRLSLHASRALFLSGRLARSTQFLDQAEQALQENPAGAERDGLLGITAVYRAATAAMHGQIQQAIQLATQAQTLLPDSDLHARARAADSLGLAHAVAGHWAKSEQAYLAASQIAQSAGVTYLAINARCEAAQAQINQGKLHLAANTCQQALTLTEESIPPLGLAWATLGQIAYEQNDLPQAAAHLNKALALSQQGGLTDDMRLALLLQIRLNLANGEVAAATAAAEQVIAILQAFQVPRLTQFADACRARLQLLQGQTAVATQWAESFANQLATTPSEAQQDFETLTLASICLTQGKLAAAQKVLTQLVEEAQANSRLHTQIEALILQTQVAQAAGNRETAVSHLTQAIHLAAPAGFVRIFLDAGAALATLLPLTRTAAPTFVNQLLAALPEQVSPVPTSPHAVPPPTELLSEQEMNVLQLLCAGLTNREIAAELVITAGTAKWHVHNILQKLDVNSRTQATVRARELGLIA